MRTTIVAAALFQSTNAFSHQRQSSKMQKTELQMGLFDGVKDAFSSPALERSTLDAERETPIDRWMGWSVNKDAQAAADEKGIQKVPDNFVDSMDDSNYVRALLSKPMGVVFEENDEDMGGIFVQALTENGAAEQSGMIQIGDQLVAVGKNKVSGMAFDEALGTIVDSSEDPTPLLLFRGTSDQLYGPTGASQDWLDEFISK